MKKKKNFTRFTAFYIIMGCIFTAIVTRLVFLQLIDVDLYRDKANRKAIKEVTEPAPRGEIFDKNGGILATTVQSYMISYTETDESKAKFFDTMEKVFKLLDQNGEVQDDDFELKIDPYRFEFKTTDAKTLKWRELRFKKDKGFDEEIINKLYKDKKKEDLTTAESNAVDDKLLAITPEETFNKLWNNYTKEYLKSDKISQTLKDKINSYTPQQKRRFIVVKDAIKMQSFSGYKPVIIASNVKKETAFIISQQLSQLPGIDIALQPIRYYPNNDLASSIIGYISKINPEQMEKYLEKGYDVNTDLVGISGLESVFEDRLKGSKGIKKIEVNSQGRMVKERAKKEPYPGQSIQLTIDKNVQIAAEKSLDMQMKELQKSGIQSDGVDTTNSNRGAAVVMDVNTGAILAMASRPGFNPNDFVKGKLSEDLYKQYFQPDLQKYGKSFIENRGLVGKNSDKNMSEDDILNWLFPIDKNIKGNTTIRQDFYDIVPKPLYNYALQALIPPGSTFKPVTALAGLEEGVITPYSQVNDNGVFNKYLSSYTGACWMWNDYHTGHGLINVVRALAESCNYFFYDVGEKLYEKGSYNLLAKYAWKLGLGVDPNSKTKRSTGIELSDIESYGQVYNIDYAKKIKSVLFLNGLISDLKNGTDRQGNHFKAGLNITVLDNDSEDVKNLKQDTYNVVRDQIVGDKVDYNKAYKKILDNITKLSTLDPNIKPLGFTKKDLENAANAAMFAIYDGHTEIFTQANVYDASIGQGLDSFTPLQLCNYIATMANGGTRYKAHLVDKYLDENKKVISSVKPEVLDKLSISPVTYATIIDGMTKVTSGEDGTAASVFSGFPIITAGKTGSATVNVDQDKFGRTSYGVYVGFAPADKPKIAVCVVIFDGGHGGFVAPVAKSIYEAYFKDELKSKYNYTPPSYEDYMVNIYNSN